MAAALPENRLVSLMDQRMQFAMLRRSGNTDKILQNVVSSKKQELDERVNQFSKKLKSYQTKVEDEIDTLTTEVVSINIFEADQKHLEAANKNLQEQQRIQKEFKAKLAEENKRLTDALTGKAALQKDLTTLNQALKATPKVLPAEVILQKLGAKILK